MLYETYHQVKSIKAAIDILLDKKYKSPQIIAGGTDILPQFKKGIIKPDILVDISKIKDLTKIRITKDMISIGAAVTFTEIIESKIIRMESPLLIEASKQVGSPQIRNMGTIGGNICTASGAADLVPCLFALDAKIILVRRQGERTIPIRDFILSNRKIPIKLGELVKEVAFKRLPTTTSAAFIKLGLRESISISVVNAAVILDIKAGVISDSTIVIGCVGPKAICCKSTQELLKGKIPSESLFKQASEIIVKEISPIDDIRGSAVFRLHLAKVLVYKALNSAVSKADIGN